MFHCPPSPCGVDHSLLRLLLGVFGLVEHLVEVRVQRLHLALELPLGHGCGGEVGLRVSQRLVVVGQLRLGLRGERGVRLEGVTRGREEC